ncbi:hypothetical protein [Lentibacillus jeotgali]|nr:hypothetical protein [Lentibacillus jeotgali]
MKLLDWQMVLFVGGYLIQDYWLYWGLPRVYYWRSNPKRGKVSK